MTDTGALLVVDDDPSREDLADLLRMEGFTVVTAKDSGEARERLADGGVALVLLDIVMPETSGLDLLAQLRQTYDPNDLPIVMMSAKDQSGDVVEALERGANDYVTKPLDLPVLLARVNAQLRMRRLVAPRETITSSGIFAESARPGALLGGRYRLASRLGEGSFGVVFRGTDEETGRPVAVKLLRHGAGASAEAVERLNREGLAGRKLQHRHAVAIYDVRVPTEGAAFLVMELLEGRSLDAELAKQSRLPAERAAEIAFPICDVLADAHAMGIVHRDVKPANVFLHREAGQEVVKVLDFGIAKPMGSVALERQLTLEGAVLGSPAYMAPERLRNRAYDGRADVYSLGVVIYQMLAGRLPFESRDGDPMSVVAMHLNDEPPPLSELCPSLRPEAAEVVMTSLAKDPERRPQAAPLARALAAALDLPLPAALTPDHLRTLRF